MRASNALAAALSAWFKGLVRPRADLPRPLLERVLGLTRPFQRSGAAPLRQAYALPGAMHWASRSSPPSIRTSTTVPSWLMTAWKMLRAAIGGEKSFGPMMATVMPPTTSPKASCLAPGTGSWKRTCATIDLVRDFPLSGALTAPCSKRRSGAAEGAVAGGELPPATRVASVAGGLVVGLAQRDEQLLEGNPSSEAAAIARRDGCAGSPTACARRAPRLGKTPVAEAPSSSRAQRRASGRARGQATRHRRRAHAACHRLRRRPVGATPA